MKTQQLTFSIENISKKNAIIEEIYLVQQMKYIPEIGKVCKLHMKKTRMIKVATLDQEKIIIYFIGQYKYYDESMGNNRYKTESIPNVSGKMRHSLDTVLKSVLPALENEATIAYAAVQSR